MPIHGHKLFLAIKTPTIEKNFINKAISFKACTYPSFFNFLRCSGNKRSYNYIPFFQIMTANHNHPSPYYNGEDYYDGYGGYNQSMHYLSADHHSDAQYYSNQEYHRPGPYHGVDGQHDSIAHQRPSFETFSRHPSRNMYLNPSVEQCQGRLLCHSRNPGSSPGCYLGQNPPGNMSSSGNGRYTSPRYHDKYTSHDSGRHQSSSRQRNQDPCGNRYQQCRSPGRYSINSKKCSPNTGAYTHPPERCSWTETYSKQNPDNTATKQVSKPKHQSRHNSKHSSHSRHDSRHSSPSPDNHRSRHDSRHSSHSSDNHQSRHESRHSSHSSDNHQIRHDSRHSSHSSDNHQSRHDSRHSSHSSVSNHSQCESSHSSCSPDTCQCQHDTRHSKCSPDSKSHHNSRHSSHSPDNPRRRRCSRHSSLSPDNQPDRRHFSDSSASYQRQHNRRHSSQYPDGQHGSAHPNHSYVAQQRQHGSNRSIHSSRNPDNSHRQCDSRHLSCSLNNHQSLPEGGHSTKDANSRYNLSNSYYTRNQNPVLSVEAIGVPDMHYQSGTAERPFCDEYRGEAYQQQYPYSPYRHHRQDYTEQRSYPNTASRNTCHYNGYNTQTTNGWTWDPFEEEWKWNQDDIKKCGCPHCNVWSQSQGGMENKYHFQPDTLLKNEENRNTFQSQATEMSENTFHYAKPIKRGEEENKCSFQPGTRAIDTIYSHHEGTEYRFSSGATEKFGECPSCYARLSQRREEENENMYPFLHGTLAKDNYQEGNENRFYSKPQGKMCECPSCYVKPQKSKEEKENMYPFLHGTLAKDDYQEGNENRFYSKPQGMMCECPSCYVKFQKSKEEKKNMDPLHPGTLAKDDYQEGNENRFYSKPQGGMCECPSCCIKPQKSEEEKENMHPFHPGTLAIGGRSEESGNRYYSQAREMCDCPVCRMRLPRGGGEKDPHNPRALGKYGPPEATQNRFQSEATEKMSKYPSYDVSEGVKEIPCIQGTLVKHGHSEETENRVHSKSQAMMCEGPCCNIRPNREEGEKKNPLLRTMGNDGQPGKLGDRLYGGVTDEDGHAEKGRDLQLNDGHDLLKREEIMQNRCYFEVRENSDNFIYQTSDSQYGCQHREKEREYRVEMGLEGKEGLSGSCRYKGPDNNLGPQVTEYKREDRFSTEAKNEENSFNYRYHNQHFTKEEYCRRHFCNAELKEYDYSDDFQCQQPEKSQGHHAGASEKRGRSKTPKKTANSRKICHLAKGTKSSACKMAKGAKSRRNLGKQDKSADDSECKEIKLNVPFLKSSSVILSKDENRKELHASQDLEPTASAEYGIPQDALGGAAMKYLQQGHDLDLMKSSPVISSEDRNIKESCASQDLDPIESSEFRIPSDVLENAKVFLQPLHDIEKAGGTVDDTPVLLTCKAGAQDGNEYDDPISSNNTDRKDDAQASPAGSSESIVFVNADEGSPNSTNQESSQPE